jgi:SAM-dependent methyltransferase
MLLRTPAARMVAALPRGLRWRTRNAIALARWIGGAAERDGSYADAFWDLHAGGDWNGFARAIVESCAPASVVDVGCGDGKMLGALRACSGRMPLLGIDASPSALRRAARAGASVERHDLASIRPRDRRTLRSRLAEDGVAN